MPKYNPAGRGRLEVLLADKKNTRDDLTFCPVQSFDSDKLARDFAALLALFHFQRAMPLERKLPEPYSSTWLGMVQAAKAEEETSNTNNITHMTASLSASSSSSSSPSDRIIKQLRLSFISN